MAEGLEKLEDMIVRAAETTAAIGATADPAEVPMTRSAAITRAARSGSKSCRPRSTPSSQAMPATPPPARTSARFTPPC